MSFRPFLSKLLLIAQFITILLPSAASPLLAQEVLPSEINAGFTLNVNTLVDEWSTDTATMASSKCSLREAFQAMGSASNGNQGCGAPSISNFQEYTLNLQPGTYLLTRDEDMPNLGGKKIVIDGKGAVTIDGNSKGGRQRGIFHVASGELILIKLKLQNGWRPFGGAIWIKGGGGGVVRGTEVEFYRNLADNNSGNGDGGAVSVDSGEFICVKCKFTENRARFAGGAISGGGVVILDRADFFRNHAEINGGAYANYGGSELNHSIIRDSKFRENFVYQTNVPATWPAQYKYTDDQSGGGAFYNKGFVELEKTQFIKNYTQRSKGGGAIYNQGEIRMTDVAITDSKAKPDTPVKLPLGGAILNDSTLIARRVSIHYNEAAIGGAIMNRTAGRLFLVNSTVAENLATTGGGIENGHNFPLNGAPAIDNGGEIDIYHSTIVRNHDNNQNSTNLGNIVNGTVRMANSILDSECAGVITTHGGNIFLKKCQRISSDNNTDLALLDYLAQDVGAIGLEGLADNGGASLPEAQFLSVKVAGNSPAIDYAQNAYCTDPALIPLFLMDKDQIQGKRPVGPKCDSGAIEVGTVPPQYFAQDPEGAGFNFPLTVFGKVWESEHVFVLQNKGGGSLGWKMEIVNDAGGVFRLLDGPAAGGLGKDEKATLTFQCQPNTLGWHDGLIVITTDQPTPTKHQYPVSCKMVTDLTNPSTYRNQPPGPTSAGQAAPGGQTSTQVQIGNQGVNPMNATINMKDATADTIKFTATPGVVSAAGGVTPQVNLTIPQSGTVKIDITCTPPAPGLYVNTLEITTNDPIDPLLSYDISCEGAFLPNPETLGAVSLSSELPAHQVMGLALSPDGKQVAGGYWDSIGLILYGINDLNNGGLSKQGTFSQPSMGRVTGVRYSADGKNLYYSSATGDGVGVASRAANGTLTAVETITRTSQFICGVVSVNPPVLKFCPIDAMSGARALDISPDDQTIYVTGNDDDTLTVLHRNPSDGTLSYSQKFTATIAGSAIMTAPFGVLVSPDGKNVYVAGRNSNSVIAFRRDPNNGRLSYLMHATDEVNGVTGLGGAIELAISPDGEFLYALGYSDGALQIFKRSPTDGFLTVVESIIVGDGPYHVIMSNDPEGSRLLVALWTGDAIKSYKRDYLTGKLTPLGDPAGIQLDGPVFLVTSADDQHVYASLFEGKGVEHLRSQRHAPVVQNLSPASLTAGGGDVVLTVNGDRFYPQSTVLWNGVGVATEFVNTRRLRATIAAGLTASVGTINVSVRTGQPGGGDSSTLPLAVIDANTAPIPAVESLSPAEITLGGEPLNVVVTGAGFTAQSQARLNGAPVDTTYINPTMLLVQLTADDVGSPGPLAITVVNGAVANTTAITAQAPLNPDVNAAALSATGSTPVKFEVAASDAPALPSIGSFAPGSLVAGSGEQWLTIKGYNFSAQAGAESVVLWNGAARETVIQDQQTLAVRLLAADLVNPGAIQVTVYTLGAGESDPKVLSILSAGQNPVAQIDSASVQFEEGAQILVSGADFVAGAEVRWNGVARATTVVNPFVLVAAITQDEFRQGGLVQVVNPGSGVSNGVVVSAGQVLYLPVVRR